ncbi:caspase family protein [Bradyrhizobium sp. LTSP885]|uniref:caspase family protein n=1 Tax=Bradyrhizobium sp. LTSP885 TaxID=1619232 RepID=UPI0006999BFE|nr:caspase family protein [Bradyrhizobium sp. LTSP885]
MPFKRAAMLFLALSITWFGSSVRAQDDSDYGMEGWHKSSDPKGVQYKVFHDKVVSLSNLSKGCDPGHPFSFEGKIAKIAFDKRGMSPTGFSVEFDDGQRLFINVEHLSLDGPGMDMVTLGWTMQGLQTLIRPNWHIKGSALSCGAAGRISLLDKILSSTSIDQTVAPSASSTASSAKREKNDRSSTDRRIALVIGNSTYASVPQLPNPERDARLVAETLKQTGFNAVTLLTNLSKGAMETALQKFALEANQADWAIIYYAGHGMEIGGVNFLVPTDAKIAADRDTAFEAVSLEQVLNAAERAKKLRLVILDACRDNPFKVRMKRTLAVASRSVSSGLAAIEPDAGTLVVYAAKDGQQAFDGEGVDSPFTLAFVREVQIPDVEVRRLFDLVRDDVLELTNRRQQPFSYGSISGRQDFYFVGSK